MTNQNGKPHVVIAEARFYDDVSSLLIEGALSELEKIGATYETISVLGALELPIALQLAHLRKDGGKNFDTFIALGCVIRGETAHYDVVANESAAGLNDLSANYSLAVGNGILTCENLEQAIVRADPAQKNKGAWAVRAALQVLNIKKQYKVTRVND